MFFFLRVLEYAIIHNVDMFHFRQTHAHICMRRRMCYSGFYTEHKYLNALFVNKNTSTSFNQMSKILDKSGHNLVDIDVLLQLYV